MDIKAKIVAVTQPLGIPEVNTAEEFIAYAARVSNPKAQSKKDTGGLVKYLIKEHHWSPFEMVHVNMEINTTRDIARQILRHRSFSFQEFSQRYADVTLLGDSFEIREARLQDTKNRQNSVVTDDSSLQIYWKHLQEDLIKEVEENYKRALDKGIAKEQARVILPEGITKSRLYMSGTLRSWIHYCQLRMGNGTQKEHMEIAADCWDALGEHFPNIIEAVENSWVEPENPTVVKLREHLEDGLFDSASETIIKGLLGVK